MVAALSVPIAPRRSFAWPAFGAFGWTAALLVAAAVVLRLPQMGNPVLHIDDQFYLLVGRSFIEGELPYVDIWDRKPLGLFLIYGGIALLGGAGVIQYQLVATAFAAATAIVVARIARRFAGPGCAAFAGICYLASLGMLGGGGGQSPVFYNLFTAGAALLTLDAIRASDQSAFLRRGFAAMLLAGLAIFVKQTAFPEGGFFGLCLLWSLWTRTRSPARVAGLGLAFAACGIAPTAAAFVAYAAMGHAGDYWFATFLSIFLKQPLGANRLLSGAMLILISLLPLVLVAAAGLRRLLRQAEPKQRSDALFLAGWLAAAVAGFLIVPNFFDHYSLHLFVPMSVAAAPMFDRERLGRLPGLIAILWAMILSSYPDFPRTRVATAEFDRTAAIVERHLRGGCLYVNEGPVHLYTATGACRLTPYVFPDHLRSAAESTAIGIDAQAELRRVLAARPTVIVTSDQVFLPDDPSARRILHGALERSYRHVGTVATSLPGMWQDLQIWALEGDPPNRQVRARQATPARRPLRDRGGLP